MNADTASYARQIRASAASLTLQKLYEVWSFHQLAARVLSDELKIRRQEHNRRLLTDEVNA